MRVEPLPNGWKRQPLGHLFDMQLGKMLSKQASAGPEQRPYVANRHVQWEGVDLSNLDTMSFTASERQKYKLLSNDLLVCEGGEVGRTALWTSEDGHVYFQKAIHRLRAKDSGILPIFVLHFMRFAADRGMFSDLSSVTSIAHLTQEKLAQFRVATPPLAEQRCIAEILETLDAAIHETEAIIAKHEAVKQGLLHDLLTRGIDANGELRPPQVEAPDLYKPSPLGSIPKEWDVVPLGDLADSLVDGPFGSNLKTAHYVENPGVRVVRLQNILPGEYDDSERAYISDKHAASLSRNRVVPGDVLIASLGDANYPVGRSCSYPTELPDAVNKADCFRFRASARCRNDFVMLAMNGAVVRKQVRGYEQGVTMKRINLSNLRRIDIVLPRIAEQDLIIERLQAAYRQIDVIAHENRKLRSEKSGLMDDVLTGRVRVAPRLDPPAPSTAHGAP